MEPIDALEHLVPVNVTGFGQRNGRISAVIDHLARQLIGAVLQEVNAHPARTTLGVTQPSVMATLLSTHHFTTSLSKPGETMNLAPISTAFWHCSSVMTVPAPTSMSGQLSATALIASGAAAVRNVISITSMPPERSACAVGTASLASSITTKGTIPVFYSGQHVHELPPLSDLSTLFFHNKSRGKLKILQCRLSIRGIFCEFILPAPIQIAVRLAARIIFDKVHQHIEHFFWPDMYVNLCCCESVDGNHFKAK